MALTCALPDGSSHLTVFHRLRGLFRACHDGGARNEAPQRLLHQGFDGRSRHFLAASIDWKPCHAATTAATSGDCRHFLAASIDWKHREQWVNGILENRPPFLGGVY